MDDINKRIILARKLLQITLDPSVIDDVVDVSLGRKPWCLVKGLEAAEDERKQPKRAIIAGLGILGLMNLRPTGYKYEHEGKLVHDIMPLAGNDDLAASTGRAFLPFHSDMAFLRFPRETSHDFKAAAPDFLVLAGVLNEPKIPTEIIVLKGLLEHMDGDLVAELRKSQFNIASPATVTPPRTAERIPILYGHTDYGEMIRYNGRPGVITGTDEQAEQCVARLGDAISKCDSEKVDVQPGTALVFNNRQVIHGRRAIEKETGDTSAGRRHFKRFYGQRIDTDSFPLTEGNLFIQGLS